MRMNLSLGLALALLSSGLGACTTVLYKGPARPASEISVLTSKDVRIVKVDTVRVNDTASGNNARFEVLPGDHEVAVALNRFTPGFLVNHVQTSRPLIVCVELEAGHVYRVEPVLNGARWVPRVIDVNDRAAIDPFCDEEEAAPSRAAAPAAPAVAPTPAVAAPGAVATGASASAAAAPPATSAPEVGAAAAPAPDAGAASLPVAAAPPDPAAPPGALAPAPAPVPAVVDREQPRRAARSGELSSDASAAVPSGRRPGTGFSLFTGFALGGDDFVKATSTNGNDQSLSAGQGFVLGIGAMATPFWPADTIGFGVGIDGSLKYDGIDASNGSASITRFPVALSAHLLTNGSGGDHYFMLKGGIERDFGVSYSASGFDSLNASVPGTWGPLGAVGYYKRSNDSFAWDLMGFFALTKHVAPGGNINADSFGLTVGVHWNL
jgi:hypothetical protein